jgi:hypothetical protein
VDEALRLLRTGWPAILVGAAGARVEHARDRLTALSPRERDIALASAVAQANADIAATLHLSVATVTSPACSTARETADANRSRLGTETPLGAQTGSKRTQFAEIEPRRLDRENPLYCRDCAAVRDIVLHD